MSKDLLALVGTAGLLFSLAMILGLYLVFSYMGNGRFVHFRRFFFLQAVAYAAASIGILMDTQIGGLLLLGARILTPVSYGYLVLGILRRRSIE